MRPEDCLVDAAGLQASVSLVSPLGSETHATVNLAGVELVARLAKDVIVHPGATLGLKLDPARLHQEALLLAAKADVREELDRLKAHVAAARDLLA
ncbi:MAG: endoribonuclease YicC domain-containing protein, partial [Betaproteobacteria bacterium]